MLEKRGLKMTKIFAHRGASLTFAENTMPAFKAAIELKADGIELDVQKTKDGQIVVTHDENVKRVTGVDQKVVDFNYADLKALNAAAFRNNDEIAYMPLLEEVLDLIQDTDLDLNIELKNGIVMYPEIEEDTLALVQKYNLEERVIFSCFNHYSIMKLMQLGTKSELAFLYAEGLYEPWKYASTNHVQGLHPFYPNLILPEYMENARKEQVKIRPWTVDDPEMMKKMFYIGVDGLITNDPATALAICEQMQIK